MCYGKKVFCLEGAAVSVPLASNHAAVICITSIFISFVDLLTY